MTGRYAKETSVSVAQTRAEIEDLVTRYGASEFGAFSREGRAVIGFKIPRDDGHVVVRVDLPLPARDDEAFAYTPTIRLLRAHDARFKAWEQACRSRWRALLLVIKAKLEAVECGISTLEREFLYDIVTGDGRTVGQILQADLGLLIEEGRAPPLLPGPEEERSQ